MKDEMLIICWDTKGQYACMCFVIWLIMFMLCCCFKEFFSMCVHSPSPLLLLLLLSRFSRVRLCATPWTAAYQASPSMGFSRQEHWSGLPFPSPMHESEK